MMSVRNIANTEFYFFLRALGVSRADLGFWLGGGCTCQTEMHRKRNLYMLDNV